MQDRFLRACRREPVDRTPVWFMRQAGRYLAEYRGLREDHGVLEIARTPELAVRVARLPVEKLGVDAAILFADIMLPLEPMGVAFEIVEGVGPVVAHPVREAADVDRLASIDPAADLPFIAETIGLLRDAVDVPVIGFAGAPFTLASYLIEGRPSRDFAETRRLMLAHEGVWHRLQEVLADMVGAYLRYQVQAGAHAIQLFDSWVGALSRPDYEAYVQPHVRTIFKEAGGGRVPRIHFGTNTSALLEAMRGAGGEVIGLDWRVPLDEGWRRLGDGVAVQGNLDPAAVLAGKEVALARTRDVLRRAAGRPGHIFNLGHGVLPGSAPDVLAAIAAYVHEFGRTPE